MPEETSVIFCLCSSRGVFPEDVKSAVLGGLRARGVEYTAVHDLCGLAAARDPSLRTLADPAGKVTILACHPRAVRWLLHAAGVPIETDRLQVLDLRSMTAEAILSRTSDNGSAAVAASMPALSVPDEWPAWFPVIDYDRCIHCKQCLSFCLFGVYSRSADGKVAVANPHNCKNNCPACARICPQVAILFPKLGDGESPLNGDEIGNEAEWKARARVNVKEVLGDDVYAALAERRQQAGRRRLLRKSREQAESERATCSTAHGVGGDAPQALPEPRVLRSESEE